MAQADIYVSALLASINQLKSFPEIGEATGRRTIRRLVHQKHVVIYEFKRGHVVVLRITSVRVALPLGSKDDVR